MTFTKEELEEMIWCLKQMEDYYESGTSGRHTYIGALIKLEDKLEQMTLG